jgi:hypothetical protein
MTATFSLSSSLRFLPKWVDSLAATSVTDTVTASLSLALTDGTAAEQANGYWRDVVSVAAGATVSVDLRALPMKAFAGTGTLTISSVKALLIVNRSALGSLTVGGTISNRWAGFAAGGLSMPAGAVVYATNSASGWAVSSSSKNVAIENGDAAVTLTGTTATASGSATTITGLSSTSALAVGMTVAGTGIPANATVTAIASATSVTISAAATAAGSRTLTFCNPAATVELYFVGVSA